MPSHQDRRDPLPAGYQYGDASVIYAMKEDPTFRSAVRGLRRAFGKEFTDDWARQHAAHWNVIEGEDDGA